MILYLFLSFLKNKEFVRTVITGNARSVLLLKIYQTYKHFDTCMKNVRSVLENICKLYEDLRNYKYSPYRRD